MQKKLYPLVPLLCWALLSGSCKKDAAPTYNNVAITFSLIDYNTGPYSAGTWSTGTKIRIRYAGTVIDSLTSLYGAFNLPRSTVISNACTEPLNKITHTFKMQSNVINSLEFIDQYGIRISYDLTAAAIYIGSSSDTTTGNLPNTGCHLSVFPVR
jgi:hypothetical protein